MKGGWQDSSPLALHFPFSPLHQRQTDNESEGSAVLIRQPETQGAAGGQRDSGERVTRREGRRKRGGGLKTGLLFAMKRSLVGRTLACLIRTREEEKQKERNTRVEDRERGEREEDRNRREREG